MRIVAIGKWTFTAVGLAMLVGAALLARSTRSFLARAATVEGVVVELVAERSDKETYYHPVVQFSVPGGRTVEFRSSTGTNPPSYARGERVRVLYDPDDPKDAKLEGRFSLWGGTIVLGFMGTLFATIGGGFFAFAALRRWRRDSVRRNGTRIETTFQRVEPNLAIAVNGRHPFRIVSQWLDPARNEVHVFVSEDLWFDPSPYLTGPQIPVLIERGNPRRYWVDVSFLPKLAA